jgi:plasmid stability protein
MATLTIRDLDESLKQSLRVRAAHAKRSMEEEARQILRAALLPAPEPQAGLAQRVRARFAGLGDIQLPLAEREPVRPPPGFGRTTAAEAPAAAKRVARSGRT